MIAHPLYLPDYTLGHMMSHQIRSYMRGKDLAAETKRITSLGCLTPDLWMNRAVASPGVKRSWVQIPPARLPTNDGGLTSVFCFSIFTIAWRPCEGPLRIFYFGNASNESQ